MSTFKCSFNCTLLGTYTITINPTPSDATVILTADGYTQDGNSITVTGGTTVNYTVQDANENNPNALYAWDYNGTYIYTKSSTPSAGDILYNADGDYLTEMTIESRKHYDMKIESADDNSISIMATVTGTLPSPEPS